MDTQKHTPPQPAIRRIKVTFPDSTTRDGFVVSGKKKKAAQKHTTPQSALQRIKFTFLNGITRSGVVVNGVTYVDTSLSTIN